MARGCNTPIGDGDNLNAYALIWYDVFRDNIDGFPSAPVACDNRKPYR